MKTGTKAAIALLVAGVVCCTIAASMGATIMDTDNINLRFLKYRETAYDKQLTESDTVSGISLRVDTAKCTVRTGDRWALSAGDSTTWKISGNTLIVEQNNPSGWWFRSHPADVSLTVPEGTQLATMDIDVDAGTLEVFDIQAQRIACDLDAGTITARGIQTNGLTVDCDAGHMNLSGVVAGDASLNCDVGNILLALQDGSTIGRVSGKTDLGNVDITMNGQDCLNQSNWISQEFSCSVPGAIGNNLLTIDCDVGKIDVQMISSGATAATTTTTTATAATTTTAAGAATTTAQMTVATTQQEG